jgi:tyrosine-protein phosphatase non-receptor type 1
MSDSNVTNNNNKSSELRYRRAARQEALQEKVREIKRKQKEEEIKKINLPKKRRSLLILSGVILALSVFAYVYVKT